MAMPGQDTEKDEEDKPGPPFSIAILIAVPITTSKKEDDSYEVG